MVFNAISLEFVHSCVSSKTTKTCPASLNQAFRNHFFSLVVDHSYLTCHFFSREKACASTSWSTTNNNAQPTAALKTNGIFWILTFSQRTMKLQVFDFDEYHCTLCSVPFFSLCDDDGIMVCAQYLVTIKSKRMLQTAHIFCKKKKSSTMCCLIWMLEKKEHALVVGLFITTILMKLFFRLQVWVEYLINRLQQKSRKFVKQSGFKKAIKCIFDL